MTHAELDENMEPSTHPGHTKMSPQLKKRRYENSGSLSMPQRIPLRAHASVRLRKGIAFSTAFEKLSLLENNLKSLPKILNWRTFALTDLELSELFSSVSIGCCSQPEGADITEGFKKIHLSETNVHFYRPCEDGALAQQVAVNGDDDEAAVGSQLWNLPCIEFESIWENLIYDTNLKNDVMSYVYSLVLLSEKGARMTVINVNRLILLLGPPGTGKTSLCKGLSQLLSIRMNKRYPRSVMFEINSHSLFSKWFSESGKLVMKMFDQIDEMSEDKKCMVFVLIDEVESLGMARESSASRGDPADSIRAVNALLTQIDRIRRRENVLVLCTSNLEDCLDRALLDRADMIQNVGRPTQRALFSILSDCISELQRINIVENDYVIRSGESPDCDEYSQKLWNIAEKALGLSGRSIRQVPALACSKAYTDFMTLEECLNYFEEAVTEKLRKA
ncbi:unnamed protein product [Auanema sp. JU1783]|nr:unnamed protein product [Auanema sp. JU1783]